MNLATLSVLDATALSLVLLGIAARVLLLIWLGRIDLTFLLADENGDASFSRFQCLVFTFVVAGCIFDLTLQDGKFPEIDGNVLILMGISGATYATAKGIQANAPATPSADHPKASSGG